MEYSKSVGIQVTEAIDMKYVDRGDPEGPDFESGDLTQDGNYHTLSLAGIVPAAGANHLVHIIIYTMSEEATGEVILREVGNTNFLNWAFHRVSVGTRFTSDMWVMMDATRQISYRASEEFDDLTITIRGYWTD